MSEQVMRQKVVKELKPLDAVSVENPAYPGTPDVNYIEGWIELKQVERWPERGGPLRVDHFTKQQRAWIRRRHIRGGKVHVLLRVGREYLLFPGHVAAEHLGFVPRERLLELAERHWNHFPKGELLQCMR